MQKLHENYKSKWVAQMGSFTPTVDASSASDGILTKKLKTFRESVEEKQKELTKSLSPHKLWARNAGLV